MTRWTSISMFAALVGFASLISGCATAPQTSDGDQQASGPVSTVSADPLGAALFGDATHPEGSSTVANLDLK